MNFNDWEQFLKNLLPGVPDLYLLEVQQDMGYCETLHVQPIRHGGSGHFNVCLIGGDKNVRLTGLDFSTNSDFTISCETWKLEQGKLVMAALPPNFIAPRQNQWPPMVPPNQVQTAPPSNQVPMMPVGQSVLPSSRLKAPLPDAYDILKFLEAELPVATGMLAATNFFVTGFSIPDGQDYRDVIRRELPNIRTILGDKVGFIHPDSKLLSDTDGEYATGKFAVTLTYHLNRQEAVAMMLALVKA